MLKRMLSAGLRGHTLIESLVVVGIIGILAAVLYPIVAEAKTGSQAVDDLGNIGRLARSAAIYAEDADKTFLAVGSPAIDFTWSPARNPDHDAAGHRWMGWGTRLAPYARSYDAFRSSLFPPTMSFQGGCASATGMAMTNNYSLNWMLGSDGTYGDQANMKDRYAWSPDRSRRFNKPVAMDEIVVPEATVTFLLSGVLSAGGSELNCLGVTVKASDFTNQMGRSFALANGANLAFADGHARFIEDTRLVPSMASPDRKIYHLPSRNVWMEPTMPDSSMGFQNLGIDEALPATK